MSLKQIENDIHKSYQKILNHRFSADTLESDNKIFREKIALYTSIYPATLTYKFGSLRKDNIDIVSSEDSLLRIYSWDTWQGGTMHYFENIFQYKSNNKVFSKVHYDTSTVGEGDYVPFYSQLFTLKTHNKIYYLAVSNGMFSTKDVRQSLRIFTIENNMLIDSVRLIKTKKGLVNSIDVDFDFFSAVERPERPLRLIRYDNNKKIIYIPIVYANGKVTNRFILYKFTGEYFEYIGKQRAKNNVID